MNEEIKSAIMTILGTLPVDAEARFFWKDGSAHFSLKLLPEEPAAVVRLNRAADGSGVVLPEITH